MSQLYDDMESQQQTIRNVIEPEIRKYLRLAKSMNFDIVLSTKPLQPTRVDTRPSEFFGLTSPK